VRKVTRACLHMYVSRACPGGAEVCLASSTPANHLMGRRRGGVQRYRIGEKYNSHHDYFSSPTSQLKDDRIATFLIYLKVCAPPAPALEC
jgi:hypothetical protein